MGGFAMGMAVCNASEYTVHILWQAQAFVLRAGEQSALPLPRWNGDTITLYPVREFGTADAVPTGAAKRLLHSVEEQADALFLPVACTYVLERPTAETRLTVSVMEYDVEDYFADELEYRYCRLSADNTACTLSSCKAFEEKRTRRALLRWKTVSETAWYGWIGLIVEYPMLLHRFRYYCRPQIIQTFLNSVQNTL